MAGDDGRHRGRLGRTAAALVAGVMGLVWPATLQGQYGVDGEPVVLRPPDLPREFRGAWVATVGNIDWPSRRGLSKDRQQAELRSILDRAMELHLNAVIFQIRPAADALYRSEIEPWSPYLTGRMGRDPGYDPLEFAVEEAHSRGLELHAWFNPFRARASEWVRPSQDHVMRTHPEHVRTVGSYRWMDPGEEWVRKRTLAVIVDVVRRYDIDAVHIDDYFYPYPPRGSARPQFPDEKTWQFYRRNGGKLERDDWRRDNVNKLVKSIPESVQEVKPWVRFGISPFGIWRPRRPPEVEAALDSYRDIFADSRHWLRQGWCDYLAPQLYWRERDSEQPFGALMEWWQGENTMGRHLWPGIAVERVGRDRYADEIVLQVGLAREHGLPGASGHIMWNMSALADNRHRVADWLQRHAYRGPTLVPATPWLDREQGETVAEGVPPRVRIAGGFDEGLTLKWNPLVDRADGGGSTRWWLVQAYDGEEWRLARRLPASTGEFTLPAGQPWKVASVRAIDRLGRTGPYALVRFE